MKEESIGLIELSSIAAGYAAGDAMLKAANVRLILSRSICSGKYMVLVGGASSAVESALAAGTVAAAGCLIDEFIVHRIHPDVLTALGRTQSCEPNGALGVVESFNVGSLLRAADAAAKTAEVTLLEIRLAMALGGKAFMTLTGPVASVEAAVQSARETIAGMGALVNAIVLPRPHPDLYRELI